MTAPYPAWAQGSATRRLIAQVVADAPRTDYYNDGMSLHVPGRTARMVRDVYNRWYDARIDLCSTVAHASPEYVALRDETLAVEDADALMDRLIVEALQLVEVERISPTRCAA